VRCLSGDGYEVGGVAHDRMAPGFWSRAVAERRLAPDPRCEVGRFVAALETLVRSGRYDVLLPGTDAALLAVSRHRGRLAPHVRLGLAGEDVVERALDKAYLGREAALVGLAPPEGPVCTGAEEALSAARELGFPVIVKPVHTVVERAGAMIRSSSLLARDPDTVASAARALGRCIVQRRVDGRVISFAGVASGGRLLATAVSRYLRTWPPEAGNAAFSQTIPSPAGLAERVRELVARLGWEGMFELELIEQGDGRVAAIDFNPRIYGSLSLAVAAGVALPTIWCARLLGEPTAGSLQRDGARYRWEDGDVRHAAWRLRHGGLGSALAVLRPRRDVTHAYFRVRDPGPCLARGIQMARGSAGAGGPRPSPPSAPVVPLAGVEQAREPSA
jgi:predicted ATP-grasp superfamily ATP-dependent carboligase